MKRTLSPLLQIGLLIFVLFTIVQGFIVQMANWIAIPVLVLSAILIITGGIKTKK